MMQLDDYAYEFWLIGWLVLVKFDESLLQDVEEGVDTVVVRLLLKPSCKSWINWHMIYKLLIKL